MKGIDIPESWERSVERIISENRRKIMMLGAVDTGKSTYCGFLSRRLIEAGLRVAVVDADVGQKDIGPPAAITLGYPAVSAELTDTSPALFYFVGSVSPAKHLLPMVVGTGQLVGFARAQFIIINTTGMIHGLGRILKAFKIEALRPDIIVAIQKANELKSLLWSHRNHVILNLRSSQAVSIKPPEQRRAARERAFYRYFANASQLSFSLKSIIFQRSLLFSGKAVKEEGLLYRETTSEGDLIIAPSRYIGRGHDQKIIPEGFEQELLCGVADRQNRGLGLAIIRGIDFRGETISLLTPVRPDRIKIIQFGDIYIGPDGRELDRKKPGYF